MTDLWDAEPKPEPLHGVMNSLLDATPSPPPKGDLSFQTRLESFCRDTSPTLTICPSLTLLMAISYLERLKEVSSSRELYLLLPPYLCNLLYQLEAYKYPWYRWMCFTTSRGGLWCSHKVHTS